MIVSLLIILNSLFPASPIGKADLARKELERLQGTWMIESNTQEGKEAHEMLRESKRYTVDGNHWRVSFKGAAKPLMESLIVLDPSTTPKSIDMVGKGGTVLLRGAYEIDGDRFRVCFPLGSNKRPTEIKSEAGSRTAIIVYKRAKD